MVMPPPGIQARSGLCKLPVFRPVALKMLKLLGNEQAEVQGIAGLLRSDPALSAQVLTVANSAFYGHTHHTDNLARAILVLGFERTKALTLTVALRSFLRQPANTRSMECCWQHSMAAALVAEELAPLYEIETEQAYTAALIHDVGRLGLLMAYGDRYAPLLETPHATVAGCLESERSLFQMDHCQAGLWLTQRWGFPSVHSRVAGCHHDELPAANQDLASLAHVACLLADALGFRAVAWANPPSVAEVVPQLPIKPWSRYTFDEQDMKARITKTIATIEAA
jgi:HD-like signal output (HDOD) protein